MELGISTFVETTPDVNTGTTISHAERLREVVEEIVLADQVGLDVYGVGEHHRHDFAASSPAVVLAAAACKTTKIRLTSAVMILSSADPVRVFQDFATLDGLSNGRAEIMVGRGSFLESFPLFGYDLDDYEELFDEKLELLLHIQKSEKVSWSGKHRPAIQDLGIYPRPVQDPLPVWIGSAGSPESAIRAGAMGLPFVLAIIGGVKPLDYASQVELYKKAAAEAGHDVTRLPIASHSHGFVAKNQKQAIETFFPSTFARTNVRAAEKGAPPYTRADYDAACSLEGALYVGDPETVAQKIIHLRKHVGVTRFMLHMPHGTMPHEEVMEAIRLFGTEVAPRVREEAARWEQHQLLS
ncbi:LLM class flavin-dependent oxidoreductase [Paenibacillus thiaminolyticus]|uniref:LLM class flavin-dependent oxidoreductase n=1 Tax=Paenibacillus thiaminolyticus TaxID=49283 RepID=A0AAP9IZE2_PANTH|nr:LLM class flavin-dependent oxidoreductase [Paenibacillus thiaminolyticus]MCY9536914.1 LLM class flavin-dependent oxidoreductase [Paenibacillus thiaminolyticus]MCY9603664.1 LLM class flavin-dependent oxidoreductase [Paenibacillus thiaminolyticus]MCY9606724.1 LLM class flavin-dependent oxidoreductase [Paenibacillus thiaminolyticus]MCY9612802.1 LLM class flavin-dependent oxidoreductase [Paenibacillus thiaminolyticus]MCY9619708.1 LLM class flavin-dependent oxidoreductase [Paenibacillus thiamino